ncbi:MAG: hypothetical protein AAGJ79_12570 [Verrucomicrobiota bacterium]
MPLEIWILFGAVGMIAFGAVVWGKTVEVRRERRFREAADTLKFTYFGKGESGLPPGIDRLSQFARGSLQHVEHLMQGTANGVELTLLDLASTAGLGIYQSVSVRSVAIFRSTALELPSFCLYPRALGQKLAVPAGMEAVAFEDDVEFDRRQGVSGGEPAAVRSLFGPEEREFFAKDGPYNLEGSGPVLVIYFPQLPLGAMPEFLQTVFPVFSVFRQACARPRERNLVSAPEE